MKKLLIIVKPIILTLIFFFALYFENAAYERKLILIGLFTIYIIWQSIRNYLHSKYPYLFIVDGLIILILEYYSRYLINYSFHFFYIVIIIEIGIKLDRRRDINLLSGTIALVSIYKFMYAAYILPNGKTLAELFFNLFAQIFIITLINYSKLQSEGKRSKEQLYKDLFEAHEKLKHYNETIKEKSTLKERARIAGELHDSLGHNLTTLIMQLEMLDFINTKGEDLSSIINDLKLNARDALTKAREAVATLQDNKGKSFEDVQELITRFMKDTRVDIKFDFPNVNFSVNQWSVVYRVIQESLTNALRHGKCTEIHIIGNINDEYLNFTIEDNGVGSHAKNGFGQKNMLQRINSVGGSLEIIPGRPYLIKGRLPLRGVGND